MKAYLAGAIEHAPDLGKKWRDELSVFLKGELNHDFYNPLEEESNYLTKQEAAVFRGLKATDVEKYKLIIRKLVSGDLKELKNTTDYVICLWDEYSEQGGGTHGELTVAFEHGIPVYMVTSKLNTEISGWILACTDRIFADFDQLKNFLKEYYSR